MIALVACCGPKLLRRAVAAELYVSPLFRKSRAAAEQYGRWFILSALHGVVDPRDEIEPYNVTLKANDTGWGWKVFDQLRTLGLTGETFVVFGGSKYVGPLMECGLNVVDPLRGLGIGERLAKLSRS